MTRHDVFVERVPQSSLERTEESPDRDQSEVEDDPSTEVDSFSLTTSSSPSHAEGVCGRPLDSNQTADDRTEGEHHNSALPDQDVGELAKQTPMDHISLDVARDTVPVPVAVAGTPTNLQPGRRVPYATSHDILPPSTREDMKRMKNFFTSEFTLERTGDRMNGTTYAKFEERVLCEF